MNTKEKFVGVISGIEEILRDHSPEYQISKRPEVLTIKSGVPFDLKDITLIVGIAMDHGLIGNISQIELYEEEPKEPE